MAPRLRSQLAGCVPYASTPWREVPGRALCALVGGARAGRRRLRVGQRRVHRSGRRRRRPATDRRRPRPRRPTPPTTDAPTTEAPTTDAPSDRADATDGSTPPATPVATRRSTGRTTTTRARRRRRCSRCPSTTTIPTARRSSCSSPGTWPTDQENKIGSLLVNPGGPGFGGSDFGLYADQIYGEPLLERFDIVGWDPRGTGLSEPAIDCIDDYDELLRGTDITPDDDAERQVLVDRAEGFADACEANNADIIQHVGTNNSARDMDTLRQALGEDEISYFGFSYGSELGATWATLFPDTVRAAVLDGASDPNASQLEGGLQQTRGLRGHARHLPGVVQRRHVVPVPQRRRRRGRVRRADGRARRAADPQRGRATRPHPRHGARRRRPGDVLARRSGTSCREALADAQRRRRRRPPGAVRLLLPAQPRRHVGQRAGGVPDDQLRRRGRPADGRRGGRHRRRSSQAVAPRFAPDTTGEYFCTFFPPSTDPRVAITGAGAGPIVVIGTTGDPATPLESTRTMASTLEDGRLVVVTADQHTGYKVNDCVDDIVHDYLVDLEVPPEETTSG